MRRFSCAIALFLFTLALAWGQESNAPWLHVEFPRDSPVLIVSSSLGPTTMHPRGVSMALSLQTSLVLRNVGTKPLCGLTLRVEAQDLNPAGKGSVSLPSLNVQPGEVFPVHIDMELLRPFNIAKTGQAIVQVSLDCALFNDLSSYGPDVLQSRRALTVYELEGRRDRRYLAKLLETGRLAQLREELNFGLSDFYPEQLGLELLHRAAGGGGRNQDVSVGSVSFPSSPVQPVTGVARISGNEISSPRIELKNLSRRPVQSLEMGWIVRDDRGRNFVAGSTPAVIQLAPVQTATMKEPGTMRLSNGSGEPVQIEALLTFVDNVEFANGSLWIPSRRDINEATSDPVLRRALATSPEQQRLADIYRKKGIGGLAQELKKGN